MVVVRFSTTVAFVLIATFGITANGVCRGDAPVEGDAALLKTLIDVQATNLTLFPKGELTAEGSEKYHRLEAKATVIWDGSRTYTRFHTKQVIQVPVKGNPDLKEDVDSIQDGEMIEVPGVLMVHFPSLHQARRYVDHVAGTGYVRELLLRPDQIWFSSDGNINIKELISPSSTKAKGVRFVIKRDGPERVVIERHIENGSFMRYVASLAAGGNIVSYERVPSNNKSLAGSGFYSWDRDLTGRWYLREFGYKVSLPSDPKRLNVDYSLRVTDFNADPVIPSNRFEFSSFKFEKGTVVEEGLIIGRSPADSPGHRKYRVGKEGPTEKRISESQLNSLSDKLRAGGFAAPDRTSK